MGLQIDDSIMSINKETVDVWNISSVLKEDIGKDIEIAFMRGKKKMIVKGTCPKDNCIL